MPRQRNPLPEPAKRGPGQPKIEIDLDEVTKLYALGLTDEQVAVFFDVSLRTIESRKLEPDFARAMNKGKLNIQMSLRQKQLEQALKHSNITMLIWPGKNILGQRDKPIEGEDERNKPPVTKLQVEWVAPKPDEDEEKGAPSPSPRLASDTSRAGPEATIQ